MAFFEIGKPAPEKLHIEVNRKSDRSKQYHDILEAVTGSFYRLFETKELYKITIDIRLEKVRDESKRGSVDTMAISDTKEKNTNVTNITVEENKDRAYDDRDKK